MPRLLWVERTWEFDFPVDLYPNLIERLRGTPARLEEAVAELPPETLTRRSGESWSILEHAGHLLTLEALPAARLEDFLSGATELTAADMSNRATMEARYRERPLIEILSSFRDARHALTGRLDALAPVEFARTAAHPRLATPMRLVDLLLFHADHDDHHLARISELRRA